MKFRSDFVTNSSSSSFVVAMSSDDLNQKQKDALIRYIFERFLGNKADDDVISDIKEYYKDSRWKQNSKEALEKALDENKIIRCGYVLFEESDYSLADIYQEVWRILEKNADNGDFVPIDTDLSY